jgi:hypothetical protein
VKEHTFAELDSTYLDADTADKSTFAEMKTNLLMIDGDHYARRKSEFYQRVRNSKELNEQQKIRLTKNHTGKIVRTYSSNIVGLAPGVAFLPANESELRDQKVAELHKKLWGYCKEKNDIDTLIEDWADDACGIGEMACKIYWDPMEGDLVAFNQAMDASGQPLFENGQPKAGEPVYSGGFQFETLHGMNLLRDPGCKDIRKSPMLIHRKMVSVEKLKKQFGSDPEKTVFITASADDTVVVFDVDKNEYRRSVNEVMIREYFFRPCARYPKGYFFITTKSGILAKGELPGGIFPIAVGIFERIQTSPRGRSIVKVIRPFQAEINRTASKIAEHQIALGDDKLITNSGTKIGQGISMPGIRHITTTGGDPVILQGRDGGQFFQHQLNTITELYNLVGIAEDDADISDGQVDAYTLLFKSARQKKKFSRYVRRFERFLIEIAKIYVKLAKIHMPDEMLIEALGRDEQINLEEFRNQSDLCYQIHVDKQSDDIETVFGKQIVLNQILQYASGNMSPENIGDIIEAMPYGNSKAITSDLTINKRAATNDILALDRGKTPPIHEYDNHEYMIKRFVSRMREPDFEFVNPQVKQNYADNIAIRQQIAAEQVKKLQAVKDGFIPTTGYLVVCDLYAPDPNDPTKTKRARVPYDSLKWLIDKLEAQGNTLSELEAMNQGAMSQMADLLVHKNEQEQPAQAENLMA